MQVHIGIVVWRLLYLRFLFGIFWWITFSRSLFNIRLIGFIIDKFVHHVNEILSAFTHFKLIFHLALSTVICIHNLKIARLELLINIFAFLFLSNFILLFYGFLTFSLFDICAISSLSLNLVVSICLSCCLVDIWIIYILYDYLRK
jgi:hypothetical protein